MADEPMSLVERLRNPAYESLSMATPLRLSVDRTRADMDEAANRIERLETAIIRYLADSFSCNGGAQSLFEIALGNEPLPDFT